MSLALSADRPLAGYGVVALEYAVEVPLCTRWSRLNACAVTGHGRNGPYWERNASDLLIQGETGLASVTESPEEPAKVGISIADIGAGMCALAAVLARLMKRQRTGARPTSVSAARRRRAPDCTTPPSPIGVVSGPRTGRPC